MGNKINKADRYAPADFVVSWPLRAEWRRVWK